MLSQRSTLTIAPLALLVLCSVRVAWGQFGMPFCEVVDGTVKRLPPVDPSAENQFEMPDRPQAIRTATNLDHVLPSQSFQPLEPQRWCEFNIAARSYYINDQRIEFSGQEATFGVEGALAGNVHHEHGGWETAVHGEFFFNQPFDRNILVDSPERVSYRGNFETDALEISQLMVSARNGDFLVQLGKMLTPFGRAYFPLYQNSRQDAPFIRTESILWRETGLVLQFDPGVVVVTAAVMNGSEDRDTNSSKALVARAGIDMDFFAIGASVKTQDGIGSETQKYFNNHVGADIMFRHGPVTFSGEVIYDEYGFRRPFNPDNITWGRSIYYRDQFIGVKEPITGVGYYVNLDIALENWAWMLNYGEFYPKSIGDPRHDVITRRGIAKAIWHATPHIDAYTMILIENNVAGAQANRLRRGFNVLSGFEWAF